MNTESTVEINTCIVYAHTFNNQTKYFGNGVSEKRAYTQGKRGKKYLEQFELDSNPQIEIVASGLSPVDADTLEQNLLDEYVSTGGTPIQKRPNGKDLQTNIIRSNSIAYKTVRASKEYRDSWLDSNIGKVRTEVTKQRMRLASSGRRSTA